MIIIADVVCDEIDELDSMAIARIAVLLSMDILAIYAMYMMMVYLTDVWKLGFTHAAAIVNVFWGIVGMLPILQAFIVDTIMGNYWMLLISSMAYSAGLGLLSMSTPPVLAHSMGTCSEYAPECVGEGQKMLFYAALTFIAIGMSGHFASLETFMAEQFVQEVVDLFQNIDSDRIFQMFWRSFFSTYAIILVTCAAVFALPYIKPWSLRFGIPAICTLFATLLFLSGSCSYKYVQPKGSPLTTFMRVFVAAVSKVFHRTPRDAKELHEIRGDPADEGTPYVVPHTRSLSTVNPTGARWYNGDMQRVQTRMHRRPAKDASRTFWKYFYGVGATILFTFVAVFGLPYVEPWSLRFGIPAICTLVATLLFFSGSCSYKRFKAEGSPLTMIFRVFVAAVFKILWRIPRDPKELFELHHPQIYVTPHTNSLRCLDKAAIVLPSKPLPEQAQQMWKLCTVTEVEETKTILRMIPVWATFILCGVVSAIGFTYFIEQLDHLNHRVGSLRLPSVALLLFFNQAQTHSTKLYSIMSNRLAKSGSRNLAPPLGIAVSMILAILCCITAARVEQRRLVVVRQNGLVDKPDSTVPMSMFWLVPQFVLLGGFDGIFSYSAICFFADQSSVVTLTYTTFSINAVSGVGILVSVFVVKH